MLWVSAHILAFILAMVGLRPKVKIMAQLTIYLDEKTQLKAKNAAKRANCSLSQWAREQLSAAADAGQSWPEGYFDLFGSVQDPSFKEVEAIEPELDSPRAAL